MAIEPNITKELVAVQSKLHAPKNQRNKFGNYNYRSAEDILEAVKPILKEHNLALVIEDEIVEVGGRVYVKATASVTNPSAQVAKATAYAREPEDKKGMDHAQITGATSSYARKYALNGLFAIDDTKDADSQDNTQEGQQPKSYPKRPATAPQKKMIFDLLLKLEVPMSEQKEFLHREFGAGEELGMQMASEIIKKLKEDLGDY